MLRKQKSVALLGLGAILLLPTGFNTVSNAAFGATEPQPVPVATFYDPDGVVGDDFGAGVALSADGSEALIGAAGASESGIAGVGKAYIYTQINGIWQTIPEVIFVDPTLQPMDSFGGKFALSADGATALFSTCNGVVYVYSRINDIWQTAPVAILHDPSSSNAGCSGDAFGSALAISADGNTALVNAPIAPVNGVPQAGMVYVFARGNGVWSSAPVAIFTDPGDLKWDMFGASVALSADGTVALIGTSHVLGSDRVFEFSETAGSWSTAPTAEINIPPDGASVGTAISLSSNADIALIGLPSMDKGLGAAYVYTEGNQTWSTTPSVVFNAPAGEDVFGSGATLSANGNVAVIPPGNVYIYVQMGTGWSSQAVTVLSAQPPVANFCGYYGFDSVALSSAGTMLLVGDSEGPTAQVNPPPPPGCVDGAIGRAFIYESSNNWMPPNPAPPPSDSSGGGSFSWLSVILIFGLMLCRRDWR